MLVKNIIQTDFVNYKKPSMYIAFPTCTFKCEKECNILGICQNSKIAKQASIEVSTKRILELYKDAKYAGTEALLCCGLEPFDSWADLQNLVKEFRKQSLDDIVIYTGYYESELVEYLSWLQQYPNIIVKFGRFIPGQESHYDETLGISLASKNQYAKKIS